MRPIPRISTRGYYDLRSGRVISWNPYRLYPKKDFAGLVGSKEITIMVHGLRNDRAGAVAKAVLARNRLRRLGYGHPVVGFSYDSNTTGAHLIKHARHALVVGQKIAEKNGRNLGRFIEDFKHTSPETRIRLMGHSLGSHVILSTVKYLAKKGRNAGTVESVHLFGASIPDDSFSKRNGGPSQRIVCKKITNCYAPTDDVLGWADREGHVRGPLGLNGAAGATIAKYRQRQARPRNHRFASYAAVLRSFP